MLSKLIIVIAALSLALSGPAVSTGASALGQQEAKHAAAAYLWKHYRSYRLGGHKRIGFVRISRYKARCKGTWRYHGRRYTKTVTVTKASSTPPG